MSKLSRVNQKVFGATGGTGEFGKIGSDSAGTPVTTKDLETIQELSQYDQGLFGITANLSEPPRGQDLNALYLLLSSQIRYIFQNGIPEWHAVAEYYADVSFAQGSDGNIYRAKTGTDGSPNVNHNPVGDATNWSMDLPVGASLDARIIARSHVAGDFVSSAIYYATPSAAFPGLILDADKSVTVAAYPELHAKLAAERIRSTGGTASFTGTVSGSNVTLADTPAGNSLLAALFEDAKVHGGGAEVASYTNWRTIVVNGTAYPIVSVTTGTRVVVVTGIPTPGSQTCSFPAYLLADGTCRVYKMDSETVLAHNGTTLMGGLRRRSYIQGHWHKITGELTDGGSGGSIPRFGGATPRDIGVIDARSDGSNGTPRTSPETETRGMAGYWYIWVGLLP